jgi:hypothetical protein
MRKIFLSLAILAGLASQASAADNYGATAGSGLVFGAKDATSVYYPRHILCDNTTVSQCLAIDASGRVTVLQGTSPWVVSNGGTFLAQVNGFTSWAGGTLGAMAAYGTSPGAVNVPGVNAFVTNTLAAGQATMANSSPIVIASNQTANALWGHGATGAAVPANATYAGVLDASGGTNMLGLAGDPCQTSVKTTVPITLATAAVKVIVTGVSAKKIYVCAYELTNNAADSVAVFEATTGTTCATSAVAVVGAGTSVATAATGYNFAANGGISRGSGGFQVLQTATNANDLCIAQSAATQLTGSITYVTR